eukprot:scaffold3350_cov268-Pinguiococcus_pyrenoidosus.AAC.29
MHRSGLSSFREKRSNAREGLLAIGWRPFSSSRWSRSRLVMLLRRKDATATSRALPSLDARCKPIEALEKAIALQCRRLPNGPLPILDLQQPQRLRDLRRLQRARLI